MFCCKGSRLPVSAKNEVDKQLEVQAMQDKLKFKVLLLGSGESGKSTLLKQLKLIHKISLSPHEVKEYTYALKRNCVECMLVLVDQAQTFGIDFETSELKANSIALINLGSDAPDESINTDVADIVKSLWKSKTIQSTYARKSEFWILDSCEYYFENMERFVQDDFEPSEDDLIMARVMTTGIVTTEIEQAPLTFQMVDVGGQRNERRKWIHCFDDVTAIVFVVNLAGYNSVLFEDQTSNKMAECLALFKQTVNNALFSKTQVHLVFNKKDLFENMIKTTPITVCPDFKDYQGKNEVMDCLEYITQKFKMQVQIGSADDRVQVHHIAARFKRDVKTTWDDIVTVIKKQNAKQIELATKYLEQQRLKQKSQNI